VDFRLVGAFGKYPCQPIHGPTLPSAHLVQKHLAISRNLLDRLVAMKRIKRDLGFENNRETAPVRRLHIPPQGAEYTFTYCPIFREYLKQLNSSAGYISYSICHSREAHSGQR